MIFNILKERTLIWLLVLLPLAACGVNLPFVRLEDLITKTFVRSGDDIAFAFI